MGLDSVVQNSSEGCDFDGYLKLREEVVKMLAQVLPTSTKISQTELVATETDSGYCYPKTSLKFVQSRVLVGEYG